MDYENITVLFTQKDSIYGLLGCDCWDKQRNAMIFMRDYEEPVIAHPPCRAWGKFKGMAKPEPGERELAIRAIDYINEYGGILEHPKASDLFKQHDTSKGFLLPIQQKDFGHRARKDTYLYIVGCKPSELPSIPLRLGLPENLVELLDRKERESTPYQLAKWLIKTLDIIKFKNAGKST